MRTSTLVFMLFIIIAMAMPASAGSTSSYDLSSLPTRNVFDPDAHENVPITDLTFARLDEITMMPAGRQWNDMDALCASILILHGRQASGCIAVSRYPAVMVPPVTARAYVSFTILPRPIPAMPVVPPKPIMMVDPVYPPWPPTYNPYW